MDEFLQLNWRVTSPSQLEQRTRFLTDEEISKSYVYKSLQDPSILKFKRTVKLNLSDRKYVTGQDYFVPIQWRSLLTRNEQHHCLKALKLIQSRKNAEVMTVNEKYSLKIFTNCQQKIAQENSNFLKIIQARWNKKLERPGIIKPSILKYSEYFWKQRMKKYLDYPQFYQQISTLCLDYNESEDTVNYEHIPNILEMGILARFTPPILKSKCLLKIITLPKTNDVVLNSQLPVSEDQNIPKLLETNQFEMVISSSALKQIIDYTDIKTNWVIPVIVKEINNKKIVFIDKVLPKTKPTYHDLKIFAYKRLIKTNFCQYEAFSFPQKDIPTSVDESEVDEPDINEDVAPQRRKSKERTRSIHHNVSYRIWKVSRTSQQNTLMKNKVSDSEFNLLVRCKLDACERTDQGALQPVAVKVKIEQQVFYGANIPSRSELAREWATLFFRIYSNLYRARIYSNFSEVLALEKCSLQKINTEALTHYNYKPILGLGVLQKVLEYLRTLEPGNYLLQHLPKNESFVSILKECEEEAPNAFNLHSEYECFEIDDKTKPNWLPIDVNYIMPMHEELELMPAMFQGVPHKKKKKGNFIKLNRSDKSC